jgi:hypothetical protein
MITILVGFDAHFSGTCAYEGAPKECSLRGGDFSNTETLAIALSKEYPTANIVIV